MDIKLVNKAMEMRLPVTWNHLTFDMITEKVLWIDKKLGWQCSLTLKNTRENCVARAKLEDVELVNNEYTKIALEALEASIAKTAK